MAKDPAEMTTAEYSALASSGKLPKPAPEYAGPYPGPGRPAGMTDAEYDALVASGQLPKPEPTVPSYTAKPGHPGMYPAKGPTPIPD